MIESRWLARKSHLPGNSHSHVRFSKCEFYHYKIRSESSIVKAEQNNK